MPTYKLLQGDCLEVLKGEKSDSFDYVVTDPPYGVEASSGAMLGQVAVGLERRGGFAYGGSHTRGYSTHDPVAFQAWFTEVSQEMLRVLKPGAHLIAFGGARAYHRMTVALEDAGFEIRDSIAWVRAQGMPKGKNLPNGWSTTLRTVQEPIVVARKPLIGTATANFQQHGTGALNIAACRIEGNRWPPNFALSHLPECAEDLCAQGCPIPLMAAQGETDFFPAFRYCSKPSPAERAHNPHPTPKPLSLMEWLVTLVTPPNGSVLDPFMGSGSTGIAALNKGFTFVGIEKEPQYVAIAQARIEAAHPTPPAPSSPEEEQSVVSDTPTAQLDLFNSED
jgi:site-specific DNA-methyltransferase (adenine-specific)